MIGDFDSLAGRILSGRGGPKFLQVADQYTTDSEKALLYLENEGYEEVVLMGATGWRLDHTLFNVQLLERFAGRLKILPGRPPRRHRPPGARRHRFPGKFNRVSSFR